MMDEKQLTAIEAFIETNNRENTHVKFYPQVQDGALLGFDVRFFAPAERYFSKELEDRVFERIEMLSHRRVFPVKDGLFKHGILELKVSHVHRRAGSDNILQPLRFIAEDMIDVILGKKETGGEE